MRMYQKIIYFIKYHNAFAVTVVMVFSGLGISYAASPTIRDGIYSSTETVVAVDNGLIVSADLDNFNFNLRVNAITEDELNYYAAYSYQTLVVEDGVWQNKAIEQTFTVSKEALNGRDLGLYVAEELKENINYELAYLKRVQELEKEKGESQKIVAVAYSGLIGKLLNPKEEVVEGYIPVVTPTPGPSVSESSTEEATAETPQFSSSPLISDSTVEASTGVLSPTPEPTAVPTPIFEFQPEVDSSSVETLSPTASSSEPISTLTLTPTASPTGSASPAEGSELVEPAPSPSITPTPTPSSSGDSSGSTVTSSPSTTPEPTPEATPEPTPL